MSNHAPPVPVRPDKPASTLRRADIWLLGGIAALGSLATQLLIPALPSIASDLAVGVTSTQLVIGIFLVGLGSGQLLIGAMADRVDRRALLLIGLVVYAAGSLLAGLAGSLAVLLVARLVQAIGSSAGLVTARVLLNAMVLPEKAVAAQASLMAIVLVSPAVAPVIGGVLTEMFGWRAIMLGLCAAGLIGALVVWHKIPAHAGTRGQRKEERLPVRLGEAYRRLLGNGQFLAATGALSFASATLYLFLGAAPFLLQLGYGQSPHETGLSLLLVASASIVGTRLVGYLQRRLNALLLGASLGLGSAVLLGAASWQAVPSLPLLLGALALLGFTAGLIGPTAITRIMSIEKGLEGTATSLAGAMQMGASAFFAWALGSFASLSAFNLSLALLPLALLATACAIWLAQQDARR